MSSREVARREYEGPRSRSRAEAAPRRAGRGRSRERHEPRERWPRGEDATTVVTAWPRDRNAGGLARNGGERRWDASGEQDAWAQNRDRGGTAWRGPPPQRSALFAGSNRQYGGFHASHRPDGDGDVAPKRRRSRFSPVRVSRDRWEPSLFDRYSPVQAGRPNGGAACYGRREAEADAHWYRRSRQRSPDRSRAPRRRPSRSRDFRRRYEPSRGHSRRSDRGRRRRSSRRRPRRRSRDRPRRYSSRSRSPRRRSPSSGSGSSGDSGSSDGEDSSHLFVETGDWIGPHYQVTRFAGKGTFGRVYLCRDARSGSEAAVKALRAVRRYTEQAEIEADILEDIARRDPGLNSRVVRLLDRFQHGDHACLAFEPLSSSLYDVMKRREFRPLAAGSIRRIAAQLLHAVAFMHAMRLTHTDLKLENVMLTRSSAPEADGHEEEEEEEKDEGRSRASTGGDRVADLDSRDVRVIDFGSATYASQHHSSVINTRQYRSPEVILGQGWDESSDVWSCACIILELLHGKLLFSTHDNEEHLALMERTLGPFPRGMVRRARKRSETRHWFDDRDHVTHLSGRTGSGRVVDRESVQHVRQQRRLEDMVGGDETMLDALRGMLAQDPRRRITARQALQHAWLRDLAPPWVDPAPAQAPSSA